jgi:hypothetical protein
VVDDDGCVVGPEAAAASDLADVPLGSVQLAHLDHGFCKLLEEPPVVVGEALDEPVGAGVRGEHLVGVEHDALVEPQGDEVHVVEHLRGEVVEVAQAVGGGGGADPGEALPEVVAGRRRRAAEVAAPRLADGVRGGERDEVEVVQPLAAEGLEELVGCGGRRRQGEDFALRGGGEAVLAAEVHREGGAAGQVDRVARGEDDHVGAGDGWAAGGVHLGADALDQIQRRLLQTLVGGQLPLAVVEQDGRIATLQHGCMVWIHSDLVIK